MKKIIAIILAMIMLLAFMGCENEGVDVVTKKAGSVTKKYGGENATTAENAPVNPTTEAGPAATTEPKAPTTDKPVTEPAEPSTIIYKTREEGSDWYEDSELRLFKNETGDRFSFATEYSYRMSESDCELINANYEDVVTVIHIYWFTGSYTLSDDNTVIPTVDQVLYREVYKTAAGKDLSSNVKEYLEECHNDGTIPDEVYEVYVVILNGERGDITDQFDPELKKFILNNEDMTFEYEADNF